MKVRELIEDLQKLDPEETISIRLSKGDGYYADYIPSTPWIPPGGGAVMMPQFQAQDSFPTVSA